MEDKITRKRTFSDCLICGYNNFRYSAIEPMELMLARFKNEHFYKNSDEDPLISVFTPTYNRGSLFIERALPSVLAQTYKKFEYIIVGDCCTDNTSELVAKIKDPRIRFYNLPKRGYRYPPTVENHWLAGPVIANNKALQMVKGKWIARIDDDDVWTPDHLEKLLRFAQTGNHEFVSAQVTQERYGERTVCDGHVVPSSYYKINKLVNERYVRIGGTLTWFHRSYLKFFKYNINCWRKSWNRVNDVDVATRMYKAGVRMDFLRKPLALYLPRPGEKTVGFDAYKNTKDDKLKHFEFNNNE